MQTALRTWWKTHLVKIEHGNNSQTYKYGPTLWIICKDKEMTALLRYSFVEII